MRKILGIDIDGVITKEGTGNENIWLQKLREHTGRKLERKKDKYDFTKAFDLTQQEVEDFVEQNIKEIYANLPPAEGACEVLEELSKKNFTLYLITARHREYKPITREWLQDNKITYNELYHSKEKAPLAEKLGVELFIEDHQKNTEQILKTGIPVIIVDKYHNREIESPMIWRATSWKEIQDIILNYYNIT
ncbi:MAG: 5' nucleotidase, NT5C type [Halanaerobiales bacterium]